MASLVVALKAAAFPLTTALITVACGSTSTSSGFPPPTGIFVRAESLTTARGCGTGASQLYKYVVLVYGYAGGDPAARASYTRILTSNTFDCFADGVFPSLPTDSGTPDAGLGETGSPSFKLRIFGYNKDAYEAARDLVETARTLGRTSTAAARERLAGLSDELERASTPTWTTECGATQEPNVSSPAVCEALTPGLGGLGKGVGVTRVSIDTTSFMLADGRAARCGLVIGDADADAGVGNASGPSYQRVRVTRTSGAASAAQPAEVICPTPYTESV